MLNTIKKCLNKIFPEPTFETIAKHLRKKGAMSLGSAPYCPVAMAKYKGIDVVSKEFPKDEVNPIYGVILQDVNGKITIVTNKTQPDSLKRVVTAHCLGIILFGGVFELDKNKQEKKRADCQVRDSGFEQVVRADSREQSFLLDLYKYQSTDEIIQNAFNFGDELLLPKEDVDFFVSKEMYKARDYSDISRVFLVPESFVKSRIEHSQSYIEREKETKNFQDKIMEKIEQEKQDRKVDTLTKWQSQAGDSSMSI